MIIITSFIFCARDGQSLAEVWFDGVFLCNLNRNYQILPKNDQIFIEKRNFSNNFVANAPPLSTLQPTTSCVCPRQFKDLSTLVHPKCESYCADGLNFFLQFLRSIRNPVPFLSKFNFASIRESLLARFDRWTFQFRLRATNLAIAKWCVVVDSSRVLEGVFGRMIDAGAGRCFDKRRRLRSKSAPDRKTDGRPCFLALRVMEIAKLCNTRGWGDRPGKNKLPSARAYRQFMANLMLSGRVRASAGISTQRGMPCIKNIKTQLIPLSCDIKHFCLTSPSTT